MYKKKIIKYTDGSFSLIEAKQSYFDSMLNREDVKSMQPATREEWKKWKAFTARI